MELKVCKICGLTVRSSRKLIDSVGCTDCKEKLRLRREAVRRYSLENKDKIAKDLKAWRDLNQDVIVNYRQKYKALYPHKLKERKRIYRISNTEKISALNAKRRAAKLHRVPKWSSTADQRFIAALYAHSQRITRCLGIQFHVDHIIPLQGQTVSGLHIPSNLQVISSSLNLSKHNKFHD